jgi:hypothetical protein
VTEYGPIAAVSEGSVETAIEGEGRMSHGIDVRMYAMKPAGLQPSRGLVPLRPHSVILNRGISRAS